MEFARPIDDDDLHMLEERLPLHDPSLTFVATSVAPAIVELEFSWSEYDADALSRSAVAIGLVESTIAEIITIEGRARSEWPLGKSS